jgi:hypothetical protein
MLHYGYRPAQSRQREFDSLAAWVAPPRGPRAERAGQADAAGVDVARAKEGLLTWAEREFSSQRPSAEELSQQMQAPDAANMIALPTALDNDRGAFVVTKRVYLRASIAQVSALVNPENWEQLGEFFARTFRDGTDNDPVDAPAEAWHGVLREDFIVSWNGFATNVFKQRLKVDYSVSPQRVCTDYALMYEEDDQIALNEGFLEVRAGTPDERLPPGWIVGTMRKKLKFTSSMLNLLCPALLPMLLDSKAGGFNNFVTPVSGDGRPAARDGSKAR